MNEFGVVNTFKAPLRISLCGGGTDVPFFYKKYGAKIISFSIDRFVRIDVRPSLNQIFRSTAKQAGSEQTLLPLNNKILHGAVKLLSNQKCFEFSCTTPLPPGTGLGTSSVTAVALIKAIDKINGQNSPAERLAEDAWHYECQIFGRSIGKQDHYIAAHGGCKSFTIAPNGNVTTVSLPNLDAISRSARRHCLLVPTGGRRNAADILGSVAWTESTVTKALIKIKSLAYDLEAVLHTSNPDWKEVGSIVGESWNLKQLLSPEIVSKQVDEIFEAIYCFPIWGAKLLGAGGCGYVLVIASEPTIRTIRNKFCDKICLTVRIAKQGVHVGKSYV